MKIFNFFKSEKKSVSSSQSFLFGGASKVNRPDGLEDMIRGGYIENAIFYACVRLIVNQALTAGIALKKKDVVVEKHELLNLLLRPNERQGGHEFLEAIISYYLITGNAFVEMVSVDKKNLSMQAPKIMFVINPKDITIESSERGLPTMYIYKKGSSSERKFPVDTIGRSNIIHISAFDPLDSALGMSALEPACYEIMQHNKSNVWNIALFNNNCKPSGILNIDRSLTDQQKEELKSHIESSRSGYSNAGKSLILEDGMKFEAIGLTPQDVDFREGKMSSAKNICAAMGVPVDLIMGQATYENLQSANEQLAENTTLPILKHVISELNYTLVKRFGDDLALVVDEDQMQALAPKRERKRQSLEVTTFLTINEKRAEMGREPIPGGDTLYVDFGRVPMGQESFQQDMTQDAYAKMLTKNGYDELTAKKMAGIVYASEHK